MSIPINQYISVWSIIAVVVCFEPSRLTLFSQALRTQPLPKINVGQLSLEEFDSVYLDQKPIIIRGSTACPADLELSTIHRHCEGSIPGNYVHTKCQPTTSTSTAERTNNETHWAGLKAGSNEETVDFGAFVHSMGSSEDLRFMFDIPMVEICPTLPREIRIPPHFVNMFASHFQYRHLAEEMEEDDDPKGLCTRLPFFNMYLAEAGFHTDLHIDSYHTAFVASMCEGRKQWRVMTGQDFASVYEEIGVDGWQVNGTYVMSSIISPIDTWNPSGKLESLDVTIYEGILEPGEILYIPAGAPHAATTLDQSLMVASNDRTLQSFREAVSVCDSLGDIGEQSLLFSTCQDFRRLYPTIRRNHAQYALGVERQEDTTLAKATGCESTFDLLPRKETADAVDERKITLTSHNFREEIRKGPLIVMKSQNTAGWCLYLLKHWDFWTKGFDPPIRVRIVRCLHENQCPHDDQESLFEQLISLLQGRGTPSFLYVQAPKDMDSNENASCHFSAYHGFLSLDDLRVWASVVTGSNIIAHDVSPFWWKTILWLFHVIVMKTVYLVETIGPALVGILFAFGILAFGLGFMFLWDSFWDYAWCSLKRGGTSQSRAKRDGKRKSV
jgi:hypothetical protein